LKGKKHLGHGKRNPTNLSVIPDHQEYFDFLTACIRDNVQAKKTALQIIIWQMKTWLKIRSEFWNKRLKEAEKEINLSALRIFRSDV